MKSSLIFGCFVGGRETGKLKSSQSERRLDRLTKSSAKIESYYAGEDVQGKDVQFVSHSRGTQPKKDNVRTSDQRSRVRILVNDSTLSTMKSQNSKPQVQQQKGSGKKGETTPPKPKMSSTNRSFTCIPTITCKTIPIDSDKMKSISSTDNPPKQTEIHITSTPQTITSQKTTQTILEANGPLNTLNIGKKKGCHQIILVTWVFIIMLCLLLNKWVAVSISILCFYALPKLGIMAHFSIAKGKKCSKKLFAKSSSFNKYEKS